MNPVRDVERPWVNRREGMTLAFSQKQARAILDKPDPNTVLGLRDRAMLSVGFAGRVPAFGDRRPQRRGLARQSWV